MLFRFAMLLACTGYAKALQLKSHQDPDEQGLYYRETLGDDVVFDRVERPGCKELMKHADLNSRSRSSGWLKYQKLTWETCLKHYNEAHIVNTRRTKPLFFLHISKASGTMMCNCGKEQNYSNKGNNCHGLEEDWPYWGEHDVEPYARTFPKKSKDCRKLGELLEENGSTIEGNENFLANEGKLCNQFTNVVVMRHPINRLASHIQFMTQRAKNVTFQEIWERWPYLMSNYAARNLGGEHVARLSIDDLQKRAGLLEPFLKQTLHDFDAVFVLDSNLKDALKMRLGWACPNATGRTSTLRGGTQEIVDHWKLNWPSNDFMNLTAHNALDIDLFKEAQMISLAQSIERAD